MNRFTLHMHTTDHVGEITGSIWAENSSMPQYPLKRRRMNHRAREEVKPIGTIRQNEITKGTGLSS